MAKSTIVLLFIIIIICSLFVLVFHFQTSIFIKILLFLNKIGDPIMPGDANPVIKYMFHRIYSDESRCERLSTDWSRQACLEDVFRQNPDPKNCQRLTEQLFIDGCYFDVVRKNKEIKYCSYIKGDMKDNCYSLVAGAKKDVRICDNIPNEQKGTLNHWNMCVTRIAELSKDYSLCPRIANIRDRGQCYIESKKGQSLTADFCDLIEDPTYRASCFRGIN